MYDLAGLLRGIGDSRQAPRISTETVLRGVLVMALTRMGSLNRLERSQANGYWKKWLGGKLPSADVTGRVGKLLDVDGVRQGLRQFYQRRKRNKSVKRLEGGLVALVLDGHECACSERQEWEGCLVRHIQKAEGLTPQYYQRLVVASLVFQGGCLLLDAELQRTGEDEVAAATRLFERVVEAFPKAFQAVVADGLYARAEFFKLALAHHKEIIAVLKDERRDLLGDARSLFQEIEPVTFLKGKTRYHCWDVEGLRSWESLGRPVRVVRTMETTPTKPRLANKEVEHSVEWIWVTTLSVQRASPRTIVRLGHGRWSIENEGGFNELVNTWKANHVYTHHANAILAFWVLTMLAYNLFHSFYSLNLKPILRLRLTLGYLLDLVTTDFYQHEHLPPFHPP